MGKISFPSVMNTPTHSASLYDADGVEIAKWRGPVPDHSEVIAEALPDIAAVMGGMSLDPITPPDVARVESEVVTQGGFHSQVTLTDATLSRAEASPAYDADHAEEVLQSVLRIAVHSWDEIPQGILMASTGIQPSFMGAGLTVMSSFSVFDLEANKQTWIALTRPLRSLMLANAACGHVGGAKMDLSSNWRVPTSATERTAILANLGQYYFQDVIFAASALEACDLFDEGADLRCRIAE